MTFEQIKDAKARVLALLDRDALRARERCVVRAFVARRVYRGRERVLVGYEWCRPYASHISGTVYDCVLAYGDTLEAAIARAEGGTR